MSPAVASASEQLLNLPLWPEWPGGCSSNNQARKAQMTNYTENTRAALTAQFPNCPPPPGELTSIYLELLASYLRSLDSFGNEDE